ncbi:hypothetical protein [Dyella sp.]|uniref:hypothetical protein n=1 Tax=Dyella sp. TaxID=1869338 RepID=UPI002ED4F867
MHCSLLSTLVIDGQTGDLNEATGFWSKALGKTVQSLMKMAMAGTHVCASMRMNHPPVATIHAQKPGAP